MLFYGVIKMCQFHMQNYDANNASIPRGLNSLLAFAYFYI